MKIAVDIKVEGLIELGFLIPIFGHFRKFILVGQMQLEIGVHLEDK